MTLERWIVEKRDKECRACPAVRTCPAIATIYREKSDCPQEKHPHRDEEIHARAFPPGAAPVQPCC